MGLEFSRLRDQFGLFAQPGELVDYEAYLNAPWRSERSRELDKHGGMARPAVQRGQSMTAKLQLLQDRLGAQASQFQQDFRSGQSHEASTHAGQTNVLRAATATKGRAARLNGKKGEADTQRLRNEALHVAPWRMRVHDARRRVMMTVIIANRLQQGGKHPRRMRRVDSFSYYIPAMLQEDMQRFASTCQRYEECKAKAAREAAAEQGLDEEKAEEGAEGEEGDQIPVQRTPSHKQAFRPLMGMKTGAMVLKHLAAQSGPTPPLRAKKGAGQGQPTARAFGPGSFKPAAAAAVPAGRAFGPGTFKPAGAAVKASAKPGPLEVQPSSKSEGSLLAGGRDVLEGRASPTGRRPTLKSLPEQQYASALGTTAGAGTASMPPALMDASPKKRSTAVLLQPLPEPPTIAAAPVSPRTEPLVPIIPGATSKFGYTSAAGRSLIPRKAKETPVGSPAHPNTSAAPGAHALAPTVLDGEDSALVLEQGLQRLDLGTGPLVTPGDPEAAPCHSPSSAPPPESEDCQPAAEQAQDAGPELEPSHEPPEATDSINPSFDGSALPPDVASTAPDIQGPVQGLSVESAGQEQDETETQEHVTQPQQAGPLEHAQQPEQEMPLQEDPSDHHRFKLHLEKLKSQRHLAQTQEEQLALEMEIAAVEMLTAREHQRQEDAAAAERQLEQQWEEELRSSTTAPQEPTLESSAKLLSMYCNRGNAAWASARQWNAPTLWCSARQEDWMSQEDWNLWKARTAMCMKAGGFAVQIHANQSSLTFPATGKSFDVWNSDPWDLISVHRNLPIKDRVAGVPWGVRVLSNLVAAVEGLGGREAPGKLTVILHLTEEQFEPYLPVLRHHNFAGLDPRNIIIFIQKPKPGYLHDEKARRFVKNPHCTHTEGPGSGYNLMQLNWMGEGVALDRDGRPRMLLGTALEELQNKGVEWLVSHCAHDLGLFTRESVLDLVLLPFLLSTHKAAGVTVLSQVVKEASLGWAARTNGSVLLSPAGFKEPLNRPSLMTLPQAHTASGLTAVMELRALELQSGSMKEVVRAGKHAGTHYLLGLDRHVVHLAELAGALTSPAVTRAKLHIQDGCVHVKMDFGDVTCHENMKAVAAKARQCPRLLQTPPDLDDLLPLLRAQDTSPQFRKLLASRRKTQDPSQRMSLTFLQPGGAHTFAQTSSVDGSKFAPGLQGAGPSFASLSQVTMALPPPPQGHNIVVFVTANSVSQLAVDAALAIAKPNRDIVHLVTVVTGYLHVEEGQTLLDSHYATVARALVEARQEVLVLDREDPQLLNRMDEYVTGCQAELVVMASKAFNTAQLQSSHVLGSVTLSALKRFQVPVMVVNANCLNIQERQLHHTLRAMALVNRNATPLVNYLTDHVLQPGRGDSLVLCRVEDPTRGGVLKLNAAGTVPGGMAKTAGLQLNHKDQQMLVLHRTLAALNQTAIMAGLPAPLTVSLVEDSVEEITRVINKETVHILGYLMPGQSGKVPEQLIHLIHSSRCAVLVYKQRPAPQRPGGQYAIHSAPM